MDTCSVFGCEGDVGANLIDNWSQVGCEWFCGLERGSGTNLVRDVHVRDRGLQEESTTVKRPDVGRTRNCSWQRRREWMMSPTTELSMHRPYLMKSIGAATHGQQFLLDVNGSRRDCSSYAIYCDTLCSNVLSSAESGGDLFFLFRPHLWRKVLFVSGTSSLWRAFAALRFCVCCTSSVEYICCQRRVHGKVFTIVDNKCGKK